MQRVCMLAGTMPGGLDTLADLAAHAQSTQDALQTAEQEHSAAAAELAQAEVPLQARLGCRIVHFK